NTVHDVVVLGPHSGLGEGTTKVGDAGSPPSVRRIAPVDATKRVVGSNQVLQAKELITRSISVENCVDFLRHRTLDLSDPSLQQRNRCLRSGVLVHLLTREENRAVVRTPRELSGSDTATGGSVKHIVVSEEARRGL